MTAEPDCGFVFATTGEGYIELATRAAATLKACCPNHPIDLFTDQPITDPVFDRVIPLEKAWFRPKMEALGRSRFSKTVCLDADLFVLADIGDIFDVLDHFDFAAAQDQPLNSIPNRKIWQEALPMAFPKYNAGLSGLKKSAATTAFVTLWMKSVLESGATADQPILRELFFHSKLRIATLPAAYNLMVFILAGEWTSMFPAPRVIHHFHLHRHLTKSEPKIETLEELVGSDLLAHFQRLAASDHYLSPNNSTPHVGPCRRSKKRLHRFRHQNARSCTGWRVDKFRCTAVISSNSISKSLFLRSHTKNK